MESRISRDQSGQKLVASVHNLSVDSGQTSGLIPTAGKWRNVANYIEVSDRLKKSVSHKPPLIRDLSLQDDQEKDLPRDRRDLSLQDYEEKYLSLDRRDLFLQDYEEKDLPRDRRDLSLKDYGEKDPSRDRRSGSVPSEQGQNINKVNHEYEQIFHKGKQSIKMP